MATQDSAASNVALGTGKLFKAAPTAESGGGVKTGPHEDDRLPTRSMYDDLPLGSLKPVVDDESEPARQP